MGLAAVTTIVRESFAIGQCSLLGELVDETATRYFYRRRWMQTIAENSHRAVQGVPHRQFSGAYHVAGTNTWNRSAIEGNAGVGP